MRKSAVARSKHSCLGRDTPRWHVVAVEHTWVLQCKLERKCVLTWRSAGAEKGQVDSSYQSKLAVMSHDTSITWRANRHCDLLVSLFDCTGLLCSRDVHVKCACRFLEPDSK